MQIGMITGVFS